MLSNLVSFVFLRGHIFLDFTYKILKSEHLHSGRLLNMLKSNTYNSKLQAKINNSHVKSLDLNCLKLEQTRLNDSLCFF